MRFEMSIRIVAKCLVLISPIFGQACIILPVPTDERHYSGNLVPAALVDKVDDPTASRADVLMSLGPPDGILGDDEVFIYTGEVSNMSVVWAVGIGAPGGGVGAAGAGGVESVANVREWNVFAFGPNGMVTHAACLHDSITWKATNREQLDKWLASHCPHLLPASGDDESDDIILADH